VEWTAPSAPLKEMAPLVLVRLGLRSLMLHKLRSGLSILGVVFGVAAVVAMSSVGEGARRETLAQIEALGNDTVTVRTRAKEEGGATPGLRFADAESVRRVVPGVRAVAPVRLAELEADAGGRSAGVTVVGATPGYREATRLDLARGRFIADLDLSDRKRVAVLGAWVARRLFPLGDPLGKSLRIGGDWFQVIGVLEGRASPRGRGAVVQARDLNRCVIVPLPALDHGVDPRRDGVDEIVFRVSEPEEVVPAAAVARALLLRTTGGAPLEVVVPREILRQRERAQRVFNVVTGAVAAISLLVGGIGLMNIMLASVAERTREVGIRRALGARRRDVAAQFLVESSLLTLAGGALGSLLGLGGSILIQALAGWPTATHPLMLLVALLVALLVGIGFGFYPAWHASQLEPMAALRRE
jgi:putative ABC transport system permease protein